MHILVFGDSIVYGAWDIEGGWAQRLRNWIDQRNLSDENFYCLIYTLGISGDTTENLLERFEVETKARIKEEEETIIIFSIGINDSVFLKKENSLRIEKEKFRANIRKLVLLARNFTEKIVFVGLTSVDETKTMPVPWDENKYYTNENIRKYNEIIKSVCENEKVIFIDLFEKFEREKINLLSEDGLHPNSNGHEMIFKEVKKYLNELF